MRAGTLNKRALFQVEQETPDGAGGVAREWVESATLWCQFSPERGRERIQGGRLSSNFAGVLRVRSSATSRGITQVHRVTLDGVTYNIRSVTNPDQRNDMIEMVIETDGTES